MLARTAFWTALAVAFLALAIVAWRERKKIREIEHPMPGSLTHVFIPTPVATSLTDILRVESIGFLLAAVAAAYEAST